MEKAPQKSHKLNQLGQLIELSWVVRLLPVNLYCRFSQPSHLTFVIHLMFCNNTCSTFGSRRALICSTLRLIVMECRDTSKESLKEYKEGGCRETVLEALEKIEFPSSRRSNVRRRGESGEVLGMCLGMTECWYRGPMPSRHTRERPNLCRLLCAFAQKELPGFRFTSIQVNKDYAAELHVDKKDAGDSRIIGLGSYTGGQLWVDDGSHGGLGRVANVKARWLGFDGNLPHKVLPFEGRRYTLVFFSKIRGWSVGLKDTHHAKLLRELGFPLPDTQPSVKSLMPSSALLQRASSRYEVFCSHTLSRGGAGKTLMLDLALGFPSSTEWAVAKMSSASSVQSLKDAFNTLALSPMASPITFGTEDYEVNEVNEMKLETLPLLPSDCFARLGVSKRRTCNVEVQPQKRQRDH